MANKLFYTLSKDNASAFINDDVSKSALGIVKPGTGESFGYFVTYGQQVGASYADLASAEARAYNSAVTYTTNNYATKTSVQEVVTTFNASLNDYALKSEITDNDTKPNGTGSFSADGVDYTISFDENGTISVSKYVATTVSSVSVPALTATKTTSGGGRFYVGYSYNVVVGIDVTSTSQSVTATFKNDTKQAFEVKVYDGTSYCYTYSMPAGLANPSITFTSSHVMSDVANKTYTGVVAFNKSYTPSVDTTGEKTFTVYANDGKTVKSSSKAQSNINASTTISSKTIFAYGAALDQVLTDDNYISKSYTDGGKTFASSADYNDASKPSSVTIIGGGTPVVIFHKSLGTPTFKQLGAADAAWTKLSEVEVAGVANDLAGNGKIEATAYYVIYQHTPTNAEGTWDITWK